MGWHKEKQENSISLYADMHLYDIDVLYPPVPGISFNRRAVTTRRHHSHAGYDSWKFCYCGIFSNLSLLY